MQHSQDVKHFIIGKCLEKEDRLYPFHGFINLFNKYLWSIYCAPGNVLGAGAMAMNKKDISPALLGSCFIRENGKRTAK